MYPPAHAVVIGISIASQRISGFSLNRNDHPLLQVTNVQPNSFFCFSCVRGARIARWLRGQWGTGKGCPEKLCKKVHYSIFLLIRIQHASHSWNRWKRKVKSCKWDEEKMYKKAFPSHGTSGTAWFVTMWRTSIFSSDAKAIRMAMLINVLLLAFNIMDSSITFLKNQ